jgi:hypothetical protein
MGGQERRQPGERISNRSQTGKERGKQGNSSMTTTTAILRYEALGRFSHSSAPKPLLDPAHQ